MSLVVAESEIGGHVFGLGFINDSILLLLEVAALFLMSRNTS